MNCQNNFDKFDENISLKSDRIEKINSAVSALTKFVSNDRSASGNSAPGIADVLVEMFQQGSYAIGTCIRPAKDDDEFDVDIVLSMRLEKSDGSLSNPKDVLRWLEKRLVNNENYKDKIKPKDRCIRFDYAGDFHLDVVPVVPKHGTEGILWIPDRETGWEQTDPKGVIAWCNQKEVASGKRFKRITKYLKWWRSAIAPDKADVSSIILTKLIGGYILKGSSDGEVLVASMILIRDWLDLHSSIPKVEHPSIDENLASNWTQTEYNSFKSAFKNVTTIADEALNMGDRDKSIKKWKEIFGNQFPAIVSSRAALLAGSGGATFPNRPISPNKPGGFA